MCVFELIVCFYYIHLFHHKVAPWLSGQHCLLTPSTGGGLTPALAVLPGVCWCLSAVQGLGELVSLNCLRVCVFVCVPCDGPGSCPGGTPALCYMDSVIGSRLREAI